MIRDLHTFLPAICFSRFIRLEDARNSNPIASGKTQEKSIMHEDDHKDHVTALILGKPQGWPPRVTYVLCTGSTLDPNIVELS